MDGIAKRTFSPPRFKLHRQREKWRAWRNCLHGMAKFAMLLDIGKRRSGEPIGNAHPNPCNPNTESFLTRSQVIQRGVHRRGDNRLISVNSQRLRPISTRIILAPTVPTAWRQTIITICILLIILHETAPPALPTAQRFEVWRAGSTPHMHQRVTCRSDSDVPTATSSTTRIDLIDNVLKGLPNAYRRSFLEARQE